MSRELDELRRLAREERSKAWSRTKLVPARLGDVASAFAKRHPILTTGAAAAVTATMLTRRHKRAGVEGKSNSLPMAVAALGAQLLPDLLRIAGLTVPTSDAEHARESCEPTDDDSVDPASRGSGTL